MPQARDVNINVNIDPRARPSGIQPSTEPNQSLTAASPFENKQTLGKLAAAGAAYAVVKRVAAFGIDRIGEITGNEELERRIKDDIATVKKIINPVELAVEVIDFNISLKNQQQRIIFNAQFNGNLVNGGR